MYLAQHNIYHFTDKSYIFSFFGSHSRGTSMTPVDCVTVHHWVTVKARRERSLRAHAHTQIFPYMKNEEYWFTFLAVASFYFMKCNCWKGFPVIWGGGESLDTRWTETDVSDTDALKHIWSFCLPTWNQSKISYSEGDLLTTSHKNTTQILLWDIWKSICVDLCNGMCVVKSYFEIIMHHV